MPDDMDGLPSSLLPIALAPFIGSFVGLLAARLPEGRPVALDRSRCDACGHVLGVLDLVPLVSYVALRGACRHCGSPIGWLPLIAELGAVAVAVSAAAAEPDPAALMAACALGWTLLALALVDWRSMRLPDSLTLPLIPAGLAVAAFLEPEALADRSLAALLGWVGLAGVAFAYRRLRGRDGLGGGDAKLLGAAGAWLGSAAVPLVLLIAAVGGLVFVGIQALLGARFSRQSAIPFGPFLAAGIWLVRLVQPG